VDVIAIGWLSQIVFYFLFQGILFSLQTGLTSRLYGARDWLLYLLPYFIGRIVPVSERRAQTVLRLILFVGVVTSLAGMYERFFIPTDWHVALGVPKYYAEFLGTAYSDFFFGLPPNYWTRLGGVQIRRAVSVYLSGQSFALPFMVVIPVAAYHVFSKAFSKYGFVLFAVCASALLLTITRMTIVVCAIQMIILLWLLRKHRTVIRVLLVLMLVFAFMAARYDSLRNYVIATVTLSDDSGQARPQQWLEGLSQLIDYPLGQGLGSTGQTSARFGLTGIGTEAGYLKLTGALGIPGLLLFAGWFGGILLYSLKALRRTTGSQRGIVVATFVVAVGFLLNNLTAPPDQSPFVIYIFGWLAGLSIQYATARPRGSG
jgi:hypothetical protein